MIIFIVTILMILQFIITFEMSMVMPLAPIISTIYQINPSTITYLNMGYAASGLLSPIFGYWADHFSMKKIIILSTLFFAFGSFIVSINTKEMYVFGRFLLGIGYYNLSSIIMSYTSTIVTNNRLGLVSGLYKVAFSLGAFASPIIGLQLLKVIAFDDIYLLLMIISVVIALFLFIIPEAQTQESFRINVSDVFDIFKDKKAKYMIWANVLLSLPTIFFYNYVSINFSSLGISQNNISVFYSVVAAGSIAAGVLISVFSDKFGKRKMSYLSTILSGLALIPFVFMSKNLLVIGFVFGLFYDTIWGLFYPVGSTFYLHKRATFLTILSSVTSLTNLLSNATGPLIYQFGGFSLLMIISAVGLVASGVYMMRAFVLDGNKNN